VIRAGMLRLGGGMLGDLLAAGPFAKAAGLLADLAGVRLTVKRVERAAEASGTAKAAAHRDRAALITARRLVPLPPSPLPDKLYAAIDGTGVPITAKETAGRDGKGEDGRARTREVKLAVFFTQDKLDKDGYPVRDRDRLEDLDYGDIGGICTAARAYPLAGVKNDELGKALGYFENNAPRMRYKWFRSRGLFVGSGAVEAGCKAVIGQRLKLSGMRWTVAGADAIAAHRCQQASRPEDQIWHANRNQASAA
jgi:hypothetical protein